MHASSIENMQKCYCLHVKNDYFFKKENIKVVDIGGANVNGSYRDIFSLGKFNYIAVDIADNDNVDVVLEDPYILPFENNSIDILISGQAFEHVEFFWLLFQEFARVVKDDGVIILIAPSAGPIHRFPVDCYRFYPDSYKALAKYVGINCLEVFLDDRGPWNDLVGVFSKSSLFDYDRKDSWPLNLYEKETAPVVNYPKVDPALEVTKGKAHYLLALEQIHAKIAPQLYLEIGVRAGKSFELSNCPSIGVDPKPAGNFVIQSTKELYKITSDEFFANVTLEDLERRVDLAFIDGMHLFEFVLRDFMNTERLMSKNGVIVIDDVYPNHPIQANRNRQSSVWTGDVWKIYYCLKEFRPDLKLTLIDTAPTGLLVIEQLKSNNGILRDNYNPIVRKFKSLVLGAELENEILDRTNSVTLEEFFES